jgi:hypothetical protein
MAKHHRGEVGKGEQKLESERFCFLGDSVADTDTNSGVAQGNRMFLQDAADPIVNVGCVTSQADVYRQARFWKLVRNQK